MPDIFCFFSVRVSLAGERDQLDSAKVVGPGTESESVAADGQQFVITGSFGVASGDTDVENLFKRADAAMYTAKQSGRNRVAAD